MTNPFEKNHTPSWSEEDLVAGIINNDPDAGAEFADRCHDAVYAYCCRLASDVTLRRDWTHDVILRLLKDIADRSFTYLGPGSLWAWFRKRAWFLVLETRRTHHRRQKREVSDGGATQDLLQAANGPDQELESTEILAAVDHCLEGIEKDDHRIALRLRLYRNLDYQEIAAELDSPLNTIRAWIRRGRLNLRRCLARRLDLEWKDE